MTEHFHPLCPHCGRFLVTVPAIPGTVLCWRTCASCGTKARVQIRWLPESPLTPSIRVTRQTPGETS